MYAIRSYYELDVLDGLPEIKVCVGYKLGGRSLDILPLDADEIEQCEPVYETLPGWKESTFGARRWLDLPAEAIKYVKRVEELIRTPVALLSTRNNFV